MQQMKLQDLKVKTPTELLTFAEEVEVENASSMRKQELMFAILKQLASNNIEIIGTGVVEILQDGFGCLQNLYSGLINQGRIYQDGSLQAKLKLLGRK